MADFERTAMEINTGILNGVTIEMETVEDTFEKSIATYDYPYADGSDLEDMGQKAHTIRFKCYFWDDAEQETYSDHVELLNSLADTTLMDFVHPKYGLIHGKIQSVAVMHDASIRTAVLDITFIEQMRGSTESQPAQSVQAAAEEAYIEGQAAQEEMMKRDIAAIIPAADIGAVTGTLDAGLSLLEQMDGFSNATRLFVAGIEKRLAAAQTVVAQIKSPADSLLTAFSYTATLPGRILGGMAQILDKYGQLNESLKTLPVKFISRLHDAFNNIQDAFRDFTDNQSASVIGQAANAFLYKHAQIAAAQRIALEAAYIYAADAETSASPEDADVQMMTMSELESSLAIVRTRMDAAVEIAREIDALKTMAASLLTQVNNVRLEREKMTGVTLDNPMPLHLVCLKYGLPYSDAERLIKVNHIPHPNFTKGQVTVYARQS